MKNNLIIAVDFDGTLHHGEFPSISRPNIQLITDLIMLRALGHKLILWTCRVGYYLEDAVKWCKSQGLEFDAVNENLLSVIEEHGGDSRKILADIYIDDKSFNPIQFISYGPKLKATLEREMEK